MTLLAGIIIGTFVGAKWSQLPTMMTEGAGRLIQNLTDKTKQSKDNDK